MKPRSGDSSSACRAGAEGEGIEMMTVIFSRVFVLEVDAKPTLAFEARNTREAQQLCKEPWLRGDLNSLKSTGVSLCDDGAKFSVRPATPEEAGVFRHGSAATKPSDDMMLVYLVELDGAGQ
jgi:hypothetical protein